MSLNRGAASRTRQCERLALVLATAAAAAVFVGCAGTTVVDAAAAGADTPRSAATAPAAVAPRAVSFSLDLPEGFEEPVAPEPMMVEKRRELPEIEWNGELKEPVAEDSAVQVRILAGTYMRQTPDGASGHLIVEVETIAELPNGFLNTKFPGMATTAASEADPLIASGLSNDDGDHFANWSDGTNYVMFLGAGFSDTEFEKTVNSFKIES